MGQECPSTRPDVPIRETLYSILSLNLNGLKPLRKFHVNILVKLSSHINPIFEPVGLVLTIILFILIRPNKLFNLKKII